jgi:hypothetical protein
VGESLSISGLDIISLFCRNYLQQERGTCAFPACSSFCLVHHICVLSALQWNDSYSVISSRVQSLYNHGTEGMGHWYSLIALHIFSCNHKFLKDIIAERSIYVNGPNALLYLPPSLPIYIRQLFFHSLHSLPITHKNLLSLLVFISHFSKSTIL